MFLGGFPQKSCTNAHFAAIISVIETNVARPSWKILDAEIALAAAFICVKSTQHALDGDGDFGNSASLVSLLPAVSGFGLSHDPASLNK